MAPTKGRAGRSQDRSPTGSWGGHGTVTPTGTGREAEAGMAITVTPRHSCNHVPRNPHPGLGFLGLGCRWGLDPREAPSAQGPSGGAARPWSQLRCSPGPVCDSPVVQATAGRERRWGPAHPCLPPCRAPVPTCGACSPTGSPPARGPPAEVCSGRLSPSPRRAGQHPPVPAVGRPEAQERELAREPRQLAFTPTPNGGGVLPTAQATEGEVRGCEQHAEVGVRPQACPRRRGRSRWGWGAKVASEPHPPTSPRHHCSPRWHPWR